MSLPPPASPRINKGTARPARCPIARRSRMRAVFRMVGTDAGTHSVVATRADNLAGLPGSGDKPPPATNCGIGVEARRSLRSRQCVFSRPGKLFARAKSRRPTVVIHLPPDLWGEPSSARVSIRKTQVILDLLTVRVCQTEQFLDC